MAAGTFQSMNADEVVMLPLDEIDFDIETQIDLLPWAEEELATVLESLDDLPN